MDLKKYIFSHCVSPKKVKVWDAFSNSYIVREVPCGECLHCKNTSVNEWITRLYAQANYSTNVHYLTLDYAPFSYTRDQISDPIAQKYARETAACWHNINSTKTYGMHPLLLRKKHLQDFFKRLRKKGFAFQYFACGEYGMHAKRVCTDVTGYGRPHFHIILFTNQDITLSDYESAWTINGYKLGCVKFDDLRANGSLNDISNNINSAKFCFRYVCKYLQKTDFDFEKLATINFHRAYFKSLQTTFVKTDTLFPECVSITDQRILDYNWSQYIRDFSPFVVCSRRPSIGLEYFNENRERFKAQDFRLFGLSKECASFPRYYIRKTKELFSDLVAVGSVSQKPSSSSRIGYISSILHQIYNDRLDFESFTKADARNWCVCGTKIVRPYFDSENSLCISDLHLYDRVNKIFYQFNGHYYTLWQKVKKLGYSRLRIADICEVFNLLDQNYSNLYTNFLRPQHYSCVLREKELSDSILSQYGSYDKFYEYVDSYYKSELSSLYAKQLKTNNSKISF